MYTGITKTIVLVLDSLGVGPQPDSYLFNDKTSNTLAHVAEECGGLNIPNMSSVGLANLTFTRGGRRTEDTIGYYGKMQQKSDGNDSSSGHWEVAGIIMDKPFHVYPDGFPGEMMDEFEKRTGLQWLGNYATKGTLIMQTFGEEHEKTGKPIIFTGNESIMNIAAHEDTIPADELYEICRKARAIADIYGIARVNARPFIGSPGQYRQTLNRKDFIMEPPGTTILEAFSHQGIPVMTVGKINELFANRGITHSFKIKNNEEALEQTLNLIKECETNNEGQAMIFANLPDFDSLYGHRLDATGYGKALERFDAYIPRLWRAMGPSDVMVMTADHGNDPTTSQDGNHTREYLPVLVYSKSLRPKGKGDLGVRKTLADIAETLAEAYELDTRFGAESFWPLITA